jgi:hypothetical protein
MGEVGAGMLAGFGQRSDGYPANQGSSSPAPERALAIGYVDYYSHYVDFDGYLF